MQKIPTVAITGRPNVGKSSLFNRILRRRAAVVSDREGVTRDRHFQKTFWNNKEFQLVDTGGYLMDDEIDEMADSVRLQIMTAVNEADLVVFLVDGRTGVTELDRAFSRILHKAKTPVLLACNKTENAPDRLNTWEFDSLGFGEAFEISALSGFGIGDFLDRVVQSIPESPRTHNDQWQDAVRFSILGRPNVGKSTLLNRILGEERQIISDVAGTTRDSIDCQFMYQDRPYVITDTAGLRKKARVSDDVEYYSNMRTLESIERSHVCILLIDANLGPGIQDLRIIQQIRQAGKGLIIAVNKWDIYENKDHRSFDQFRKDLIEKDPVLPFVPVVSISALEGQRVHKMIDLVDDVYANCRRILGREKLIKVFQNAVKDNPHPPRASKKVQFTRACQILVNPPVIALEVNLPELVDDNWKRYLTKILFTEFNLSGAPLKLNFDREIRLRLDEELEQHT
jgi:GTP-binding protein